jgi:hypothetical protein
MWSLPFALIVYSMSPHIVVAVLCIYFVGAIYLGTLSSFTSIAQLRAPTALRGRVMSVLNVLLGALYPVGSVLQGWLSDRVGQRATQAGAAVAMLGVLAVLRVTRPHYLPAIDTDVQPVPTGPRPAPVTS